VENDWIGSTIVIGDTVRLAITEPCPRCVMITLPQGDLPKDSGILRTAAQQNAVNVGVYASVINGGPSAAAARSCLPLGIDLPPFSAVCYQRLSRTSRASKDQLPAKAFREGPVEPPRMWGAPSGDEWGHSHGHEHHDKPPPHAVSIRAQIDSPLAEETLTVAKFQIYKDNQGEFRWLLRSGNGQSIASSGESYKTKAEAQGAIAVVKRDAPAAEVDDQTATTF
jgi:uncharacterized protein YegP (UPF0339 family)